MAGTPTMPEQYIARLDEPWREDVRRLHELIRATVPKLEPYVDSGGIGYGRYRYRYASGREGETCVLGISSRKRYISFYVVAEDGEGGYLAESYRDRLPKADIGKSCVRFRHLDDLDEKVLRELIRAAVKRPAAAAT